MKDFNEPGSLAPTGLHLGGSKYMVIQGEAGVVIRGKKVGIFYVQAESDYMVFLLCSLTSTTSFVLC